MEVPVRSREMIRFGAFEVDLQSRELRKHGRKIRLQDQPFQILALLLAHPGELVTREDLTGKLWPVGTFVDAEDGLNTAIKKLREALGDSAERPRFVETLPRRGYRFITALDEPGAPWRPSSAGPGSERGMGVLLAQEKSTSSAPAAAIHTSHTKLWIVVACAVTLALFAGLEFGRLREGLWGGTGVRAVRSVVVLPLENLTGDPTEDYFADGMTDALITDLAQISALRVISRTSAMQYKGTKKPFAQIVRELDVDAVVEGTVVRSGARVRIDAQLIEGSTDQHLWAKSYERDVRDVVALQGEVARAIADEIRIKVTPNEQASLARTLPVDPAAYDFYLQGLFYSNKFTPDGFQKAIGYLEKATRKDSSYAPAYARLSYCYHLLGFFGPSVLRDIRDKAEEAARMAMELDDTLAEAHFALADILYRDRWDWSGADAEFLRGLELNSNDAEGHRRYGVYLRTMGRSAEAITESRRAQELDPLSSLVNTDVGLALENVGRYDDAIRLYRRTLEMDPNYAFAYYQLGVSISEKGEPANAIEPLEKAVNVSGRNPLYLASLGNAYAVTGRHAQARMILAELSERAKREYVSPVDMAVVYAGLGDAGQVVSLLERAYEERSFQLLHLLASDHRFDGLRADPRFADIARRVALPGEQGSGSP